MKTLAKLTLAAFTTALLLSTTGCAALLGGVGGGALGGVAGDKLGNGDPAAIIVGSAVGAGIGAVVVDEVQKKNARDKARAFEEGRRYEREVAAQNDWYKATLEPEDPNWIPAGTGANRTSRQIKAQAPGTLAGGMKLNEHVETESVLP